MPEASTSGPAAEQSQRPTTRLQQGIRQPKQYTDGTIRWGMSVIASEEPSTVVEALQDSKWKGAMDVEYKALMNNKTW